MEAFFVSTGVVTLGEMGDKTQLLAMLLAARFRKPAPIILGILVATLANHALAGALGEFVARAMGPDLLRWVIGLSFLAMARSNCCRARARSPSPSASRPAATP